MPTSGARFGILRSEATKDLAVFDEESRSFISSCTDRLIHRRGSVKMQVSPPQGWETGVEGRSSDTIMVAVAQLVRAPDCGSGGCGFNSRQSPC